MSEGVLAAKQARSRETLRRLLSAAIEMLNEHGLAGATIPRIAQAAGVAPASVYRRFRDRDALFRAAFMQTLEESAAAMRGALHIDAFSDKTFEGVIKGLVRSIRQQYVRYPGLMRAFIRFAENDTDPAFREKALNIVAGNFTVAVALLLKHFRKQIKHADPRRAMTFALATAATVIEERALDDVSLWHRLPLSEEQIEQELTQMILAYLR